jgi:hypothetical protein
LCAAGGRAGAVWRGPAFAPAGGGGVAAMAGRQERAERADISAKRSLQALERIYNKDDDHALWWDAFKAYPLRLWLRTYFKRSPDREQDIRNLIVAMEEDILNANYVAAQTRGAGLRRKLTVTEAEMKDARTSMVSAARRGKQWEHFTNEFHRLHKFEDHTAPDG